MKKIRHELKKKTKVKFENYETIKAIEVDLRKEKIFNECVKSVFESVPPYNEKN
jgi:hypothetical protein